MMANEDQLHQAVESPPPPPILGGLKSVGNEDQLHQAVESLEMMFRSLASLRRDVLPQSPEWFGVMAEGPLEDIRQIQEQIDNYTAASAARRLGADLWLRVSSSGEDQFAGLGEVLGLLAALRAGFLEISEFLSLGQERNRLAQTIVGDLKVGWLELAPLEIGVYLPVLVDGQASNTQETVAEQALGDYAQALRWAASAEPRKVLEQQFSDPGYRQALWTAVKRLIPREKGVHLEIGGKTLGSGETIVLTPHALKRPRDTHAASLNGRLRKTA